jgi:hypothetical protein
MNIYAFICTRSREDISMTTHKLLSFLSSCSIKILLLANQKSIFTGYKTAFEKVNPNPEDIIILCHDDIEIRENPQVFVQKIKDLLQKEKCGFIGPAGTTNLGYDAVWWEQERWKQGLHKGKVTHIDPEKQEYLTYYGPPEDVVVLDGLFLAAKASLLTEIGLGKPPYFVGEWDFYDIHYTSQAHLKGYTNTVLDMDILHNSRGELVGRDSWHKNREAFILKTQLPLVL